MRHANSIIQIIVGALLVLLVTNDFLGLLFEYLFDISGLKAPIEFSRGGWKLKFWLIDHPPGFAVYQILFMGTGFVLILTSVFGWLRRSAFHWAIIAALVASALFVLLFPTVHYVTQETPKPFMIAQILAAAALVPAALHRGNIPGVGKVALYVAAFICAVLVVASILTSTVTLLFAVWPMIGVVYLIVSKRRKKS